MSIKCMHLKFSHVVIDVLICQSLVRSQSIVFNYLIFIARFITIIMKLKIPIQVDTFT